MCNYPTCRAAESYRDKSNGIHYKLAGWNIIRSCRNGKRGISGKDIADMEHTVADISDFKCCIAAFRIRYNSEIYRRRNELHLPFCRSEHFIGSEIACESSSAHRVDLIPYDSRRKSAAGRKYSCYVRSTPNICNG